MKDKRIKIEDWTGRLLFEGNYDDLKVDKVLEANRCKHCIVGNREECPYCTETGYSGDFGVYWVDESDKQDENVYEYINY